MADAELLLADGRRARVAAGQPILPTLQSLGEPAVQSAVAAAWNGQTLDFMTPVPSNAALTLVQPDSVEGLQVLRHSTAHLMAAAVQALFPEAKFAIGPAIEDGFYYDMELPRPLAPEDLPILEAKMRELAAQRLPYQRSEMSLSDALAWARENRQDYKVEILETIQKYGTARPESRESRAESGAPSAGSAPERGAERGSREVGVEELTGEVEAGKNTVSFYQTGTFVDLCRGPHVPDTSWLTAFRLTHIAGAYWRGDERRPMLQRIYGTAFPTQEALEQHLFRLEEARRRDHRRLGRELDLFSVADDVGGGLILWHPKGGIIRKIIEDFWREEHLANGYDLVYTPHVGRARLWQKSGHLDFYQDLMYPRMEGEGNDYYVKPMNCPFHIMIYQSRVRSYRDLPLRFAELGTVYRFERAGVLHGLLRVRGFTQDDAHIFCTAEQMDEEITRAVRFSLFFLRTFGFKDYEVFVATRREKFVGEPGQWDVATEALKRAAERAGQTYELDPGGGAFYGPKIDIKVKDALGRPWQCTTVQFDFNLPERFGISFVGEDNRQHRPFMVHRALLGSMERFLGVLIEHYGGAFPAWLAPVQVRLLPVADRHHAYAASVVARLRTDGLRGEVDTRNEKVGFKIREAEVQKIPYILVVGDKETAAGTVSVRLRGGQDRGVMPLADFVHWLATESKPQAA
ncbi:MAG: threonine--tRNA ligase [candidate division NC10 bacterium]|nr:threonine--tRNA ligase [candidate division NC10 bacterium]